MVPSGSIAATLLFVAILLNILQVSADRDDWFSHAPCWQPNGDRAWKDTPCTDDGNNSTCCPMGSECMSNNLCFFPGPDLYERHSCTDRSWEDPNCLNICTHGELHLVVSLKCLTDKKYVGGTSDSAEGVRHCNHKWESLDEYPWCCNSQYENSDWDNDCCGVSANYVSNGKEPPERWSLGDGTPTAFATIFPDGSASSLTPESLRDDNDAALSTSSRE